MYGDLNVGGRDARAFKAYTNQPPDLESWRSLIPEEINNV